MSEITPVTTTELLWYVAHTRPRCEKKLAQYAERQGLTATLPTYRTVHKYRGKTVEFSKPLFPGYLFFQVEATKRPLIYQSDYVANLLDVPDQATFAHQLEDILAGLDSGLEVRLAPHIKVGSTVRIRSGPLRGFEGVVEQRAGAVWLYLRLDFISQAAMVKVEAMDVEPS